MTCYTRRMKLFDSWFPLKKKLEERKREVFFKERDIWWTHIGINLGHEEDGKSSEALRPVLIVKKFNRHIFLGIPQTTQKKEGIYYFSYRVGTEHRTLLLSQIRVLSSRRLKKKHARMEKRVFAQAREAVVGLVLQQQLRSKNSNPPRERGSESHKGDHL